MSPALYKIQIADQRKDREKRGLWGAHLGLAIKISCTILRPVEKPFGITMCKLWMQIPYSIHEQLLPKDIRERIVLFECDDQFSIGS